MERVLIVGSGAREHAIGYKIKRWHKTGVELYFTGEGNAGTSKIGENLKIDHLDFERQIKFCKTNQVNFVVPGSEETYAAGIVDAHKEAGLDIFGPTKSQARLETEKSFALRLNEELGIDQPRYKIFHNRLTAHAQLSQLPFNRKVFKGDGLARGTAVLLPEGIAQEHQAIDDLFDPNKFYGAGSRQIIVQERIEGYELSCMAFTDGEVVTPLPPVMDHKRRFNDNHIGRNPNTGGKGAFTPVPKVSEDLFQDIYQNFQLKVVDGMRHRGIGFRGLLFAQVIVTETGPRFIEYNIRFGDPEFQALAMIMNFDLLAVMKACTKAGVLSQEMIRFKPGFGVAVVLESLQSQDYPDEGRLVEGSLRKWHSEQQTFHARTKLASGRVKTTGLGRVLTSSGYGRKLTTALENAYFPLNKKLIFSPASHFRMDIGKAGLNL